MKIVAVSGSLVGGGNVEALLEHSLVEYRGKPGFHIEAYNLSEMEVGPCRHCNWCMKNQTPGRFCSVEDDMERVYRELVDADGVIIASPVHFFRLSGTTADFVDRLRLFVHGKHSRGAMRNKVGGAMAVAWFRNMGVELTLTTINNAFHVIGMVVANPDVGIIGAGACSSLEGAGGVMKGQRLQVMEDELGKAAARSLADRVVELATLLKAGEEALK